ncbi:MAG: hypothetical protein JWN26_56 [Candidatus Saccharibacteria bacterium]|nr:hypothetical protein [Candidatus Saccharibacteria bacterium]
MATTLQDTNLESELNTELHKGNGPAFMQLMAAIFSSTTSAIGRTLGTQIGGAPGGDLGELAGNTAGGALGGLMTFKSQQDQDKINQLINVWLKLQADEMREIGATLVEVLEKLDLQDEHVINRLESEDYLALLKKCFRDWSAAESEDKRLLIRNLLINAAGVQITTDDVIHTFVNWIDVYSEGHFKVIKAIYNNNQGISRRDIWFSMNGIDNGGDVNLPREDSAQSDLFKLYIDELSMGHIIRQHRPTDYDGNFIPQPKAPKNARGYSQSKAYTSAFDDGKLYVLTGLGEQFVHYTMSEVVQKIGAGNTADTHNPSADVQTKPAQPIVVNDRPKPPVVVEDENTIYLG